MPYAQLIVNPVAGAGRTAREWPHIKSLLESIGVCFEHDLTEAPGHARELARLAAKNGCELVVTVGGDGTINEVVNGLYDSGNIADMRLGIISTGTGHDYIRTIGVPWRYREACQCLMAPRKLTVDVGVIEYMNNGQVLKRLFVNFAGLGFDAEIVRTTTQKFKALGNTSSYLAGLFSALMFYQNKNISITIDGITMERRICTVLASIGKYGGGGMLATPDANPTDGLLDILTIGDLTKPDLVWSLPRVYRGNHLTHPKVTLERTRELTIKSAEPVSIQADGELLGEPPAHLYILPAALNIIV